MKTFEDLQFIPHMGNMVRACLKFDNGLSISVITYSINPTYAPPPYEAAMLDEDGELVRNTERNHLTPDEVTEFMKEIQSISL